MPVADLGITEDEVADQYQYTKDVMTDADGNLKGLSWQGCPWDHDLQKRYRQRSIRNR